MIAGEACVALVHDFGSSRGTVVVARGSERQSEVVSAAKGSGYFVSIVEPESYAAYDRDRFIGALDDWGWYGDCDPPTWYSGRPWGA